MAFLDTEISAADRDGAAIGRTTLWRQLFQRRRFPVAIGGVGGSGTRLVAALVQGLGYDLGGDLNDSRDSLWFTLLFKHPGVRQLSRAQIAQRYRILLKGMRGGSPLDATERALVDALSRTDRPQHPADWLRERMHTLAASAAGPSRPRRPWGWKEPNTHLLADALLAVEPRLRYVHVVRNGLDMAFSSNQNQLLLWGPEILALAEPSYSPRLSLAFWCEAQRAVVALARRYPDRVLLLDYDRLCEAPAPGMDALCTLLGVRPTPAQRKALEGLPVAPASVGRYRDHPDAGFDAADLAFVAELGFPIHPYAGRPRVRDRVHPGLPAYPRALVG